MGVVSLVRFVEYWRDTDPEKPVVAHRSILIKPPGLGVRGASLQGIKVSLHTGIPSILKLIRKRVPSARTAMAWVQRKGFGLEPLRHRPFHRPFQSVEEMFHETRESDVAP